MKTLSCFLVLLIPLNFYLVHAQSGGVETSNTPKVIFPQAEEKSETPFKITPKSEFLNQDFFNPPPDYINPKNSLNDPKNKFGTQEQFIDPGEQYLKRLNRGEDEKQKNPDQFKVDQYLGDFRNNGKFVQIAVRDHESPDGDLIKIMLNDQVVVPSVLLQERFRSIAVDLVMGFNKIDFVALNQGTSGPNTAEVRVFDDEGKLVGANRWNLATGVKATYIIVKEK
ncbi:hypothetical protein N9F74_01950 [Flavobacteriaceae bacterium]|nr:hypothetical protein [Flavobacteriaceae bacterium]